MSEPVIVLDHLSKSFGNVHAVQDLSLHYRAGNHLWFSRAEWRWQNDHHADVVRPDSSDRWQCNNRRRGCLERSTTCSDEVRLRSATL